MQTTAEADAFVGKVIAYESYRAQDGSYLDLGWPRRVVIAADSWGGSLTITEAPTSVLGDDQFRAGTGVTVIQLAAPPASYDLQLIADISDTDRRELPWNQGTTAGSRGWHYARSATDHTPSAFELTIFGVTFPIPVMTRWIVVRGPVEERDPRTFIFDSTAQDGSMADQEQLRVLLGAQAPGAYEFTRLYTDETDLTPAQQAAGPVHHLTSNRLGEALNAGPHFVSLSGHGDPNGCCGGSVWQADGLTNGGHTFIAYADSCLTNQFEGEDAYGEALVKNPNGGAVAYVGSSRFSWIGLGDDVQRQFFHRMRTTQHLGLLNDIRVPTMDMVGEHAYARWIIFSLNLTGDPEMPVWKARRPVVRIKVEWVNDRRIPVVVVVDWPKPDPHPRPEPDPIADPFVDVLVHLRQGEREWQVRPDRTGRATFDVSQADLGPLTLTVSSSGAVPEVRTLDACGPVWLEGTVVEVEHRQDGRDATMVRLRNDQSELALMADGCEDDYPLIVDAAVEAFVTGREVSVLVAKAEPGARIERFRFGPRDW